MASKDGPRKCTIPSEINPDYAKPVFLYKDYPLLSATDDNIMRQLHDLEMRSDDVFIVGYPKSGTNWLQVLLSDIHAEWGTLRAENDNRVPLLEVDHKPQLAGLQDYVRSPSPRLVKSHLPYHLFPRQRMESGCKVIYVVRNPKDLCVSYFHMLKGFGLLTDEDWNDHFIRFLKGKMWYGNWSDHVTGWMNQANDENILVLRYEDMKKDLASTIGLIGDFIGRPLDKENCERIAQLGNFDNMKTSKTAIQRVNIGKHFDHKSSNFLRKGTVGDWKNKFTVTQNILFDRVFGEKMKEGAIDMGKHI